MPDQLTIQGKNALVTGANRGLGAALVDALIERGAAKVYCGARDPSALSGMLHCHGARAQAVQLDMTKEAQIRDAGARLDDVDLLISNAGVTYMTPLMETTLEHSRLVMETNFFGPLQLIYAFAETLRRRRGGFIYILSLAGQLPARGAEIYSASKAAGAMLGHGARGALPEVAVSLVYPGLMDTDMMAATPLVKTSPREVANRSLDGWLAGQVSVFPDLHAEFTRDALVSQGRDILEDPFSVMGQIGARYVAARAAVSPAGTAG